MTDKPEETKKKRKSTRVDAKTEAALQAFVELGSSPTSVAKRLGLSHNTVLAHIRAGYQDPEIIAMVTAIKEAEINDLLTINWKGRLIVGKYYDEILEGKRAINPVAAMAILDRTWQQRRLLEEKPTSAVTVFGVLATIDAKVKALETERKLLDAEEE